MRLVRIRDVQVEVDLLWRSVGPLRRLVIGGELDADQPVSIGVDHAVKLGIVVDDVTTQEGRPENIRGIDISSVENDHGANKSIRCTVAGHGLARQVGPRPSAPNGRPCCRPCT